MATHSLLPRHNPSGFDITKWNFPADLKGKMFDSIDELKAALPAEKYLGEVYLRESKKEPELGVIEKGIDFYARKFRGIDDFSFDVAYGCHSCNKIIAGPPRSEDEDSISPFHPLSGSKGYDLYCTNCDAHLYEFTGMSSLS